MAMNAVFLVCVVLALGLPLAGLALVRRRLDLEPAWYGLTVVGAGAGMAGMMASMGVVLLYAMAVLPPQMTEAAVRARVDLVLVQFVSMGFVLELAKSYGVKVFDTATARDSWTAYGFSVGAGAGLVQAIWYLGARGLMVVTGAESAAWVDLWLVLRCFTMVGLEAVLGALVLYEVARNRRAWAVGVFGAVHALTLAVPGVVTSMSLGKGVDLWLGSALNAAVAVFAGLLLWRWIKIRGLPA